MRIYVLALAAGATLALAGAAAAQTMVEVPMSTAAPTGSYQGQGAYDGPGSPGRMARGMIIPDRRYNYLMKVETLREKAVRTEARDGGRLSPEHAASLQHELDKLNRVYGVKTD